MLCGGADSPAAPADALRLVLGPGGDGAAGLTIDVAGLDAALCGQVPDRFRDLIRLAGFVLAADQAFSRGGDGADDLGKSWRRLFRFVVPVQEPDFWVGLDDVLRETLGFLSDDDYRFEFVPALGTEPRQLSFTAPDGMPIVSWKHVDEVLLFSGGMDSFGGAVEEILGQGKRVVLVTHRSAPQVWNKQQQLFRDLAARAGENQPIHVAMQAVKHDDVLRREPTQRSRSFLFAAIAGAVAFLVGRDRVRFYENGVIAVNLPISRQLYGARGTRTVHPRVTRGFEQILTAVADRPFLVENPFLLKTRTDVGRTIAEHGAADLIKHTNSCAKVRSRDTMHPHCGVCSQCVDRRFAMFAAGLEEADPEEGYGVELFAGNREQEADRRLVLEYTAAAEQFASLDGKVAFASRFGAVFDAVTAITESQGITADAALDGLYRLHQRHGRAVTEVLDTVAAQRVEQLRRGAFSPYSLLAMTMRAGLERSSRLWGVSTNQVPLPIAPPPGGASRQEPREPAAARTVRHQLQERTFRQEGDVWVMACPGAPPIQKKHMKGFEHIRLLLAHPGREFGVVELEALLAGQPVPVAVPGAGDGIDRTAAKKMRAEVLRLREQIEEALEFGDQKSADQHRADMEEIEDYLGANIGQGGRPRRAPNELEQSRKRLSEAFRRAVKAIKAQHEPLAAHLQRHVKQGYKVSYERADLVWAT